jgi:hypothetical protein
MHNYKLHVPWYTINQLIIHTCPSSTCHVLYYDGMHTINKYIYAAYILSAQKIRCNNPANQKK